jgi:hypothetical protein
MKKKNNIITLRYTIEKLKEKQAQEIYQLKTQFEKTYEGIKPINLIKNTISEVATSVDLRNGILNNAIGLATGYVSKKILLGSTHNPFKKILGTLIEFGIANFIAKKTSQFTSEKSTTIKK